MKLYTLPLSPNSFKVVALIHHLGSPVEIVPVDVPSGQHRTPEFLHKNPNGLLPVLEDGDFVLWESNAIMMYLAQKSPESGLYPQDVRGQVDVQRWIYWSAQHWGPTLRYFLYERMVKPMFRGEPTDPAEIAKGEEMLARYAPVLESHLASHPFLVGDQLTLADFVVASTLTFAAPAGVPLEDYPNIRAYAHKVVGMECFRKAIPPMPAGAR